tara:strand:- start:291 stop:491 length:201 start_codon:yes stop_codon:yes gene_type:complete
MNIITSEAHGCSYTLLLGAVLVYHPLYVNGTCETNLDAYAEVEWEHLDDENITECERILAQLKATA